MGRIDAVIQKLKNFIIHKNNALKIKSIKKKKKKNNLNLNTN